MRLQQGRYSIFMSDDNGTAQLGDSGSYDVSGTTATFTDGNDGAANTYRWTKTDGRADDEVDALDTVRR
jgi:hypothetical protein